MSELSGIEARLTALEARVEDVAVDAAAARHLAASHDRELADLGVKVEANRRAINALGVQTAARFDRLETELRGEIESVRTDVRTGFGEMRGKLDVMAAGQAQLVDLITRALGEGAAPQPSRSEARTAPGGCGDDRGRCRCPPPR